MDPVLLVENRGAVRLLTMNRPDKRNALDNALTAVLLEALAAADRDDEVRCVVLTGAPPAFCAGADLSEFKTLTPDHAQRVERRAELTTNLHAIFQRMAKPVVSAINGAAMGGGAGLALAADLALMAASAKIGYPEVKHGIVGAIVMPNLVRQVGRKAAFELLATGDPIGAERAAALGMVNRVVADADLLDVACALAERLASVSPQAMAATKDLFHRVLDTDMASALAAGREMNRRMRGFRKD